MVIWIAARRLAGVRSCVWQERYNFALQPQESGR